MSVNQAWDTSVCSVSCLHTAEHVVTGSGGRTLSWAPHSHSHPDIPVQTWTSLDPILVLCALSVRWWGQVTLRVPPVKQAAGMARAEDKGEQGAG